MPDPAANLPPTVMRRYRTTSRPSDACLCAGGGGHPHVTRRSFSPAGINELLMRIVFPLGINEPLRGFARPLFPREFPLGENEFICKIVQMSLFSYMYIHRYRYVVAAWTSGGPVGPFCRRLRPPRLPLLRESDKHTFLDAHQHRIASSSPGTPNSAVLFK